MDRKILKSALGAILLVVLLPILLFTLTAGTYSPFSFLLGYLLLLGVILLVVFSAFVILLKKRKRKLGSSINFMVVFGWTLLAIIIFLVIFWQLGCFNPSPGCSFLNSRTSDFVNEWTSLQPLSPSISFNSTDQNFRTWITNSAGTSICINAVNVTELSGPCACADTLGGVGATTTFINGVKFDGTNPVTIAAGNAFSISVRCIYPIDNRPLIARNRNDPYEISMSVRYDLVLGGIVTPHIETGNIRGMVE